MALPPPFASGTDAGLAPSGALQTELTDRLAKSKFSGFFPHMGIALVDLTTVPEDADPAGAMALNFAANAKLETELAVGSLSKIAILFAAFRLRERTILGAGGVGASARNAEEVIQQIEADWKPIVSRKISKAPNDFPNLKNVFDFAPASPWKPQMRGSAKGWGDLAPLHESSRGTISTLAFFDRLRLAIRFSDNFSSGSCVRDIGFQFLNGSLQESGFADNKHNGVLWLGGDFGFAGGTPPIMGAPPWDSTRDATWVRANAKGIASYLTLLWGNRLVDQASSREMRDIMLERSVGFSTYMRLATPGVVRAWSKVGILPGIYSEGVILEINAEGKMLRYAGIGLGATRTQTLSELARIFLACVKAVH